MKPARAAGPVRDTLFGLGSALTSWALAYAVVGLSEAARRRLEPIGAGGVALPTDPPRRQPARPLRPVSPDGATTDGATRETGKSAPQGSAQEAAAAHEPGRGREADSPTDIPAKGWKDIAVRLYGDINNDRILAVAAGVTFYALLAVFPAIGALVSLYGLFADASTINDHLAMLQGVLPGGATDIISDQVKRVVSQGNGALSAKLILGLGISLWSANAGMKAVFDALNVAYEEKEKRSFIMLNLQTLACTFGALAAVIVILAAVVVVPVVFSFIGIESWSEVLVGLLRWPLILAMVLGALAVLYRFGPSRDRPRWRWVSAGSIAAGVVWLVVSLLFSWYVANFGSYDKTYGTLGAAIGFMTWIWLSTTVILVGAELNAELERQTAKDTTEGTPQPMGTRQAQAADTLGKSSDGRSSDAKSSDAKSPAGARKAA